MPEMTFDAFTTEWEFWLGQNDGANDLMTGNLCSQKCFTVRQVIIGKLQRADRLDSPVSHSSFISD